MSTSNMYVTILDCTAASQKARLCLPGTSNHIQNHGRTSKSVKIVPQECLDDSTSITCGATGLVVELLSITAAISHRRVWHLCIHTPHSGEKTRHPTPNDRKQRTPQCLWTFSRQRVLDYRYLKLAVNVRSMNIQYGKYIRNRMPPTGGRLPRLLLFEHLYRGCAMQRDFRTKSPLVTLSFGTNGLPNPFTGRHEISRAFRFCLTEAESESSHPPYFSISKCHAIPSIVGHLCTVSLVQHNPADQLEKIKPRLSIESRIQKVTHRALTRDPSLPILTANMQPRRKQDTEHTIPRTPIIYRTKIS